MGANVFMFYLFSATILFFALFAVTSRTNTQGRRFSAVCTCRLPQAFISYCSISFWPACSLPYMPVALWC